MVIQNNDKVEKPKLVGGTGTVATKKSAGLLDLGMLDRRFFK